MFLRNISRFHLRSKRCFSRFTFPISLFRANIASVFPFSTSYMCSLLEFYTNANLKCVIKQCPMFAQYHFRVKQLFINLYINKKSTRLEIYICIFFYVREKLHYVYVLAIFWQEDVTKVVFFDGKLHPLYLQRPYL